MLLLLLSLGLADAAPDRSADVLPAPLEGATASRLRTMLGARPTGTPLGRDEVLAAVDARHPKVRAALMDIERSRGEARQALGAFDPVLSVGGKGQVDGYYEYVVGDVSMSWDAGPVEAWAGWRLGVDAGGAGLPDYYGEYETLGRGEARAGLSLDLLDGLIRNPEQTRRRVAALDVDVASAQQQAIVVLLRQKAAVAWAKWVAAGRKLALENALLDVARAREQAVEARIQLGDLAAIERIRNRQILAQREAEVAEAKGEVGRATEVLALYLRTADGAPIRVDSSRLPGRPEPAAHATPWGADPVAAARASHPALTAMRSDLAGLSAQERLARNSLLPDLAVELEHARDLAGTGAATESLRQPTTMVGLKAKVPVLNLKDRGKAQAAGAKVDKARADLVWAEDQVEADVRAALVREEAALTAWRAAAETVELALLLQEGEQRRFDAGDIDLLRLWQVEQSTAKAISVEIVEWTRYQLAVADLEAAVGVTE